MPKILPQNKHVTREREYKGGKVGTSSAKVVGETRGGGKHGAKVVTWHWQ